MLIYSLSYHISHVATLFTKYMSNISFQKGNRKHNKHGMVDKNLKSPTFHCFPADIHDSKHLYSKPFVYAT